MKNIDLEWEMDFRKEWVKATKRVRTIAERNPKLELVSGKAKCMPEQSMRLRELIYEWHGKKVGAYTALAALIGVKSNDITRKLYGERKWTDAQKDKVCRILAIEERQKKKYFL